MSQQQKGLPPILRQPSRQKSNKLAKRLYKNNSMKKLNTTSQFSYLKNINPDSSILATTLTKNTSSKNLLIPSISLKRSKQMDNSQKSLQITHGKILLSRFQQPSFLHYKGDLKHNLQKSSNSKNLFKKINRYDGINEKKIIPDQLLGCSSDNQGSGSGGGGSVNESKFQRFYQSSPKSKGSKILKGFKSQTSSIVQDDETLTPNDFIQLLQQDGSITNQFCYLKKMSHPYDLKIVQFQGGNNMQQNMMDPLKSIKPSMISSQEEYITISSRGVSYFSKENSRFVPLQRWKKQAYYFNKLMGLQFFSKYRLFKNFAKWKKHIRKTAMKSTTDKLKNQLLIGDKFLRKALLSTRDSCFIMENDINYCKFDDCQNVMQFQKFKACQDQFIQNQFEKRIIQIEQDIKNYLILNMSDSMREFKEENKISTSSQGKGIPLLIGDQKNLDMPYTKEATLRIQQQKFKKFLKLIEFIMVDSKIKMMSESTTNTVRKLQQQNQTYEKQVIQSNYKFPFKGKQYIECYVSLNVDSESLILKPSRQQINYMFEDIVNKSIIKLCRNHKRIINDDDILEIIYDSNEKIVKQPETNILKVIIMGDDRQEKIVSTLNQTMSTTYSYLQIYSNRFTNLVQMYFENFRKLQAIEQYTAKDHQVIMHSLQNWKNQLTQINILSQEHESSIFLLNFRQFKDKAIRCVSECFQKMKRVIPEIFRTTADILLQQLQQSLRKIEKKPYGIQSFIEFQGNKNQITNNLQQYAQKLSQLNCIWIIMKNYSSSSQMTNVSKQQREINRLQTILNNLRTKLQQAEMNTKNFERKAQQEVKQMIPKIKQNIYKLYMKIKSSKFDVNSDVQEVTKNIDSDNHEYQMILNQVQKIKNYQRFLTMEEYNDQTIHKFSNYFLSYQSIWNFRKNISDYQGFIMIQPWTLINAEEAKKQVENFFTTASKLKKKITNQSADDEQFKIQLNDIDVLSYVFLQAKHMKPLIDTVDCLRDKSLGQKELKQIKNYFQKKQKSQICQIIDIENQQATVKDILDFKVSEQLDFIQSIVFKSKKQMQINNKMIMVNKFWIQSNASNAGKNLADNFQKIFWDILTEIDQKITVINGISQDNQVQAQDLKQNIIQNKAMFDTLRVLITQWQIHQRYLRYFDPIFQNSYWKSSTRQFKLYTQADGNWKKLLKQCKDYSLKRWASNQKAIVTLRQNKAIFQQLKKAVQQFLVVKRQIFPKFYFLSNEQLLHILLSQKDFQSIEKNLNIAFSCLKSLDIREQNTVPVGVYNVKSEYLAIRFSRVNNFQIQQMFRMLQQSIKQSIKSNLRTCLNSFQKDQFNRKQWIKQNLLQVLLFIQKSEYTKIIEYDYLGSEPDEISQYLIYQNSQIKQLQLYLKDHSDEQGLQIGKIQTLLFQEIQHREISESLIKNQVTQEESYDWQKHIRCYYTIDSAYTKFLINQIDYGYEFVDMENVYPYVILSDKQVVDLQMAFKLKHSPIIKGRQNIISNFAKCNGKHYRNILCQKNISEKYLLNVCFGAYLEGCYVQFDAAQNLKAEQLSVIANYLKQIYSTINRKDKTFSFGWKRNQININSGLIFRLSQSSDVTQYHKKFPIANRTFQFKDISYEFYFNILMEIRKKSHNNIGAKISKIIEIINELEGYSVFTFEHVKNLLNFQNTKTIQSLQTFFIKAISQIICEKIVSSKKVCFYKKVLYQILCEDKNVPQSIYEQSSQVPKMGKQKSDFRATVNNLVEITDKKSLFVIAGPLQSGKVSVISEAYRQKICRDLELQVFNIDIISEQSLFGCYTNGLWKQGILVQKLKHLAFFKQDWIVFEGAFSNRLKNTMFRLNQNYLQLANGQIVSLSPQWKFIFSIHSLDEKVDSLPKNIEIIFSNKFISNQESLQLSIEKRIKPYFQGNLQNYNQLRNNYINQFEKLTLVLKPLGFKSDYIKLQSVLRYFINILDALLAGISDEFKKSKEFLKAIEKISIWSIYWCLGSGLPNTNSNKFQKELFKYIKGDIEGIQSIACLKLQFDTPGGSFRKIKSNQVKKINDQLYLETSDLKAKANFVQLMIKGSFPVILIGKSGSGKTKFMQYIQSSLNPDDYAYLYINLRKGLSYQQFKDILFKKTRISIKYTKRKCFCSSTNKKLIIMIDDFNLLELNSQIGEFFRSCIKNGYYYDLATNEKIYIHNISFLVAENENYEFKIDNRFLKYFKPLYIDVIELKQIAEIYKQDLQGIQYSRQVFDACVSLHNFIMNLQSNGQLRNQIKFSQKNAIRIMKCLKQYNQPQNLAKIWSYASRLQYTGIDISDKVSEKIEKQILNLLNLMIQNTHQKPKPVPYLSDLLQELIHKSQLIKSQSQFEDYYEFLSFLLSLNEPHNLLSINEPLPEVNKKQILQYVAEVHSLKFVYVEQFETLKNTEFKGSMIYLSCESDQALLQSLSYICNNSESKLARYVIDCPNKDYLTKLMKNIPSISTIFHFYIKKSSQNAITLSEEYVNWINKLQSHLGTKISQRENIEIISNLISKQAYLRSVLSNRVQTAQNFIQKYSKLNNDIQNSIKFVQQSTQSIRKIQIEQESTFAKKKQLSELLNNLRNSKSQQQEEQQKRTKIRNTQQGINTCEANIKSFKLKKTQTSEKISNLQALSTVSKDVSKKLQGHYEDFLEIKVKLAKVEEQIYSSVFLMSLISIGVKQNKTQLIKFVKLQQDSKTFDLTYCLTHLFDIETQNITEELIIWALQSKSIIVCDKNNRFFRQIKKSVKKLRVYSEINSLLYDASSNQPKLYIGKYDSRINNIPQCTFLINQNSEGLNLCVKDKLILNISDNEQNKKQYIKNLFYKNKQRGSVQQIDNFQQQIYRLNVQNWQENEKILSLFSDKKQVDLKNLNDIKRQCNIFYATKDRLKPLFTNLLNTEYTLQNKYSWLIQACIMFKTYLSQLQTKFKYFFIDKQKFQKILLQLIEKKSQPKKSKKQIHQEHFVSKKTLHTIKSRQQLATQRQIINQSSNTQIQQQSTNIINQNNQKQSINQIEIAVHEIQVNQEMFIQNYKKLMVDFILNHLFIGLKSSDALYAYALLSCYLIKNKWNFPDFRQIFEKIFNKQNINIQFVESQIIDLDKFISTILQQNQNRNKVIETANSLKQLLISLKQKPLASYQKIMIWGDICLNCSFKEQLNYKYDIQIGDTKQSFLVISNGNQNPYEIIEKNILNNFQECSWCYLFEYQADAERITELAQKSSINTFILVNCKSASMIEQLRRKESEKQIRFLFLYQEQAQFEQLKQTIFGQLKNPFEQLTLVYAEQTSFAYQTLSQIYLNNLSKYSYQKPQIQQLSRIVYYTQLTQSLKSTYTSFSCPQQLQKSRIQKLINKTTFLNSQNDFYSTRIIIQILNNIRTIDVINFVKFIQQLCYPGKKEKQLILWSQMKKILSKKQSLLKEFNEQIFKQNILLEEINFEGSNFVNQNAKNILQMLEQQNPQSLINSFIPGIYKKKFPVDSLYFRTSNKQYKIILEDEESQSNSINTQQKIKQTLQKITKIINQFPSFQNLQSQSGKKQKLFYKDLLKDQIKLKINILKKLEEQLKTYKKIIQSVKILSLNTQEQLLHLSKTILSKYIDAQEMQEINSIQKLIQKQLKSIEYLEKFYQNKQNQKTLQPQHFNDPVYFLKYYLYEMNSHVDFNKGEIQARFLTQKDKQLHLQALQQCKSIIFNQIQLKNGKFDPNKNIIEYNDKSQTSKLSNIHISFSDKEITNLPSLIPIYFENKNIVNLSVIHKIKEDSVWKQKVELRVLNTQQ